MPRTKLLVVCSVIAALFLFTAAASATAPPSNTYVVNYFSNANTAGDPDGTVRIDNPGISGGNLCADIFVFEANQEATECCSCLTTPDGLRTLSINHDLTSNPLNGVTVTGGVVKIVSAATTGGTCPLPTSGITPVAGLVAWGTHVQTASVTTETEFLSDTLSSAELSKLESDCAAISLVGSGTGICTCGTGD